jgi:hypothetical protein
VSGVVAQTPMNRPPMPPRTRPPAHRPPSARRRPPPGYPQPPRRHRSRVPLVLLLLVLTIGGVAYVLATRGKSASSGTPNDFVHTSAAVAQQARSLPFEAAQVQRFAQLHSFDLAAQQTIAMMQTETDRLHRFAATATANQKPVAEQAAAAGDQAIDAAGRYRQAVAFSYRLGNANTAEQDLLATAATLDQQAKAWSHS